MKKITDQMQDDIYRFKSPRISSIVMHKSKASATLKLVLTNEAVEDRLTDKVKSETKQLNLIKDDLPSSQLRRNVKIKLSDINNIFIVDFIQNGLKHIYSLLS